MGADVGAAFGADVGVAAGGVEYDDDAHGHVDCDGGDADDNINAGGR